MAVGRAFLLEHQPAGGIEDDRVIGEPPIVIPRAAEAGQLLFAQREIHAAVEQRHGLAAAGFAQQEVPRQLIERYFALLELFDALQPLLFVFLFFLGEFQT